MLPAVVIAALPVFTKHRRVTLERFDIALSQVEFVGMWIVRSFPEKVEINCFGRDLFVRSADPSGGRPG